MIRYIVRDEDGFAVRMFWTLPEARQFLQQGWTIEAREAPPKPDPLEGLEEAPF